MPDASQTDRYLLRVRYEQGSCFGRCPVYALNVYDNGLVTYEGQRFTDKQGTWQKLLSRAEHAELLADFDALEFDRYPSVYPSSVADLSSKQITYTAKTPPATHTVSWKEAPAPELNRLADRLRSIAESGGFKMHTDTVANRPNIFGNVRQQPTQEIIVQLKSGVDPEAWVVKFYSLDLRYLRRVTPNGNYYLYSANPNRANVDDLLDLIRRDEDVLGAQTNKPVQYRN